MRHHAHDFQIDAGDRLDHRIVPGHQDADDQSQHNTECHRDQADPQRDPQSAQKALHIDALEEHVNPQSLHTEASFPRNFRARRPEAE